MNPIEELALRFTLAAAHLLWVGGLIWVGAFLADRYVLRSPSGRHAVHFAGLVLTLVALPLCFLLAETPSQADARENVGAERAGADVSGETIAIPSSDATGVPGIPVAAGDARPMEAGEVESVVAEPEVIVEEAPTAVLPEFWRNVGRWIAGGYVLGLLLMSLRLLLGMAGTSRLRRRAELVTTGAWSECLESIRQRLLTRGEVAMAWSREVAAPVVIGLVKPVILIPIALGSRLSPAQVEAVLAHELAHLRRRDHWALMVQRIAETILFFHPAVWWMSRRMSSLREEACDDLVVSAGCNPADYAEALVLCSECRLERGGWSVRFAEHLAVTGKTGSPLKRRILRLLGQGEQGSVRLGRAGWVFGLMLALGVAMVWWFGGVLRNDDSEAPLSQAEKHQIEQVVERHAAGELSEEAYLQAVQEFGQGAVVELIALSKERFPEVRKALAHLAPRTEIQKQLLKILKESEAEGDSNAVHVCLDALGYSGNSLHAPLLGTYLDGSTHHTALMALKTLGGGKAAAEIVAAFDRVPTDLWWLLADALRDIGDASVVPELERRLAMVEAPPSERFGNNAADVFIGAIRKLSGKEESSKRISWQQGQRFRYPYDGPGSPKAFSVEPLRDHYIKLPQVDPASDAGRAAIWQAFAVGVEGPGFTIDGDEVVLLNGLRAMPLWEDGPPYPTTLFDWLERVSLRELSEKAEREARGDRVRIPVDGAVLLIAPNGLLHGCYLKKTTEDYQYTVTFQPLDPLRMLVQPSPMADGPYTDWWGLSLHDLESGRESGALNLHRRYTIQLEESLFRDPGPDAVLTADFAQGGIGLGVPGAQEFVLVEADPEITAEDLVKRLSEARQKRPVIAGREVIEKNSWRGHIFDRLDKGSCYGFAIRMPDGNPVAGLLTIGEVDLADETLNGRHCLLFTRFARQMFAPETAAANPQFVGELASGLRVEMLGVGQSSSTGNPWWRADGSPLEQAPYHRIDAGADPQPGHVGRELALKENWGDVSFEKSAANWVITPNHGWGGHTGRDADGRLMWKTEERKQ